ncbi:MAG: PKD domain-containing protein, partial [Candidatus Aenigmarchaeota archaeon]|nr:PKD domain-containing protein [Candidatus Aenigmarchaeota archaeon]
QNKCEHIGKYTRGPHTYYAKGYDTNGADVQTSPTGSFTIANQNPSISRIVKTGTCAIGEETTVTCTATDDVSLAAGSGTLVATATASGGTPETINPIGSVQSTEITGGRTYSARYAITASMNGKEINAECSVTDSDRENVKLSNRLCTVGVCSNPPTFDNINVDPDEAKPGDIVRINFGKTRDVNNELVRITFPSGGPVTAGKDATGYYTRIPADPGYGTAAVTITGEDISNPLCDGKGEQTFSILADPSAARPTSLTLTPDKSKIEADGRSVAVITARLNIPYSATIIFEKTKGTFVGSDRCNTNGGDSCSISLQSTTSQEPSTVTARFLTLTGRTTVNFIYPPVILDVIANPESIQTGGAESAIIATLRNSNTGELSPRAATITFAATKGSIGSSCTMQADESSCFVKLRSTDRQEDSTVTAAFFDKRQPVTVHFLPPKVLDSTPPSIINPKPWGTINTPTTTLMVTTQEPAQCRYSMTDGIDYNTMDAAMTSPGSGYRTDHSWSLSGLTDGDKIFYIRCVDQEGNKNTNDFRHKFTVKLPPVDTTGCRTPIITPLGTTSAAGMMYANGDAACRSVGQACLKIQFSPFGIPWADSSTVQCGTLDVWSTRGTAYRAVCMPATEVCDGKDNDCDGVDEGCPLPVNGQCGTANGQAFVLKPTSNLCFDIQTPLVTPATGDGPWSWTCVGSGTGATSASCTAHQKGECKPLTDTYDTEVVLMTAASNNLCNKGSASVVTISGNQFTWTCSGSNTASSDIGPSGDDVACSAAKTVPCGNKMCDAGETKTSCSQDCPDARCTLTSARWTDIDGNEITQPVTGGDTVYLSVAGQDCRGNTVSFDIWEDDTWDDDDYSRDDTKDPSSATFDLPDNAKGRWIADDTNEDWTEDVIGTIISFGNLAPEYYYRAAVTKRDSSVTDIFSIGNRLLYVKKPEKTCSQIGTEKGLSMDVCNSINECAGVTYGATDVSLPRVCCSQTCESVRAISMSPAEGAKVVVGDVDVEIHLNRDVAGAGLELASGGSKRQISMDGISGSRKDYRVTVRLAVGVYNYKIRVETLDTPPKIIYFPASETKFDVIPISLTGLKIEKPDTDNPAVDNMQRIVTFISNKNVQCTYLFATTNPQPVVSPSTDTSSSSKRITISNLRTGSYRLDINCDDDILNTAMASTTLNVDTTPPEILNIRPVTTETTATITFNTNENSKGRVDYGESLSRGTIVYDTSLSLASSHTVSLASLTPATDYYYKVCAADAEGNDACSDGFTFTTLGMRALNTKPIVELGASFTDTPNEVELTASVSYGNPEIKYYWDFDNDGTFDDDPTTDNHIKHTYSSGGSHTARVKAQDKDGDESEDDVTFDFSKPPPKISVVLRAIIYYTIDVSDATKTPRGYVPLRVDFTASVNGGKGPKAYQWDFADGTETSSAPASTHTYNTPGVYRAKVAVSDPTGSASDESVIVVHPVGGCTNYWNTGPWQACSPAGQQTRTVDDRSRCPTGTGPLPIRKCGVCGSAINDPPSIPKPSASLCVDNSVPSVAPNGDKWEWECKGEDVATGDEDVACSADRQTIGQCSGDNGKDIVDLTSPLCVESTPAPTNPVLAADNTWSWTCTGYHEGSVAQCVARKKIDGACGTNPDNYDTPENIPVLCDTGTAPAASSITADPADKTKWKWVCNGIHTGLNSPECRANRQTSGACGSAASVHTTKPSTSEQLCNPGNPTDISGTGPWTWTCNGINGGRASGICTADVLALSSIAIKPVTSSISIGNTQSYRVIAHYNDDTTKDVTSQTRSSSSNTAIATISGSIATGISAGTATITASYTEAGITKTITSALTVNDLPTAERPTFNPLSGTSFTGSQRVTITAAGATIKYTIDDSDPTDGENKNIITANSPATVSLTKTATIKAIATKSGYNPSGIEQATFTRTDFYISYYVTQATGGTEIRVTQPFVNIPFTLHIEFGGTTLINVIKPDNSVQKCASSSCQVIYTATDTIEYRFTVKSMELVEKPITITARGNNDPVLTGPVSAGAVLCTAGGSIRLECGATDPDRDAIKNIVFYAGTCNPNTADNVFNCFDSREWGNDPEKKKVGEVTADANGKASILYFIPTLAERKGIAATCRAIDSTGKPSNWGDVYPLCISDPDTAKRCDKASRIITLETKNGASLAKQFTTADTLTVRFTTDIQIKNPVVKIRTQRGDGSPISTYGDESCSGSGTGPYTCQLRLSDINYFEAGGAQVIAAGTKQDDGNCIGSRLADIIIQNADGRKPFTMTASHEIRDIETEKQVVITGSADRNQEHLTKMEIYLIRVGNSVPLLAKTCLENLDMGCTFITTIGRGSYFARGYYIDADRNEKFIPSETGMFSITITPTEPSSILLEATLL